MSKIIEVPLSRGYVALIDAEDSEKVLAYKWHVLINKKNPVTTSIYVIGRIKGRTVYLHRFIMDAPKNLQVDHINHNGLDNRRANLRLATPSQNQYNRIHTNTKTGFRGVKLCRTSKTAPFYAGIRSENRYYNLGSFKTREEAAIAYDRKAIELHGEFAVLNFPTTSRMGELHSRAVAVAARMETERYYEAA